MTVWLDPIARHQIQREASRRRLLETGGPLFGYESDEDAVVIGAGGPGSGARHRPRSFRPDHDAVDRAIARVREASEHRYRFLGTWHTHPLGSARPSATDVAGAKSIADEPEVLVPRPLVLIQATRPVRRTFCDRELRAFRWQPNISGLVLDEIRAIRVDDRQHPVIDLDWNEVVQ